MKSSSITTIEVQFLDIKLTSNGTSVFRKSKHKGQYIHLSSFTPWSYKIACIRSLVHRAYKICSNESLISDEMRKIRKFMSWNGFPKTLANKLIYRNLHLKLTPKALSQTASQAGQTCLKSLVS
jgi:hypothetical protein